MLHLSETPSDLQGAWRSSVAFHSGPFASIHDLSFLYVFNAGGTMTESSNYDASPPVPPAYGTWRKVGPGAYEATYEFFVTKAPAKAEDLPASGWTPDGRGVFDETITVAPDGASFTSHIAYKSFDASGRPSDTGEADGKGVRIGGGAKK